MTNEDGTYNGWANYETWSVNLILTNDEYTYHDVRTMVADTIDHSELPDHLEVIQTPERWALLNAADAIEEYVRERVERPVSAEDVGGLLTQQLLGAALSEVVWVDVAEAFGDDE